MKKFYCKAKEMYGEEWVKGYPTCDKDGNVIELSYPSEQELGSNEYVLPETVSVYIGEAFNGELFENDIFYNPEDGTFSYFVDRGMEKELCFIGGRPSTIPNYPELSVCFIVGNIFETKVMDLIKWKEEYLKGDEKDETC